VPMLETVEVGEDKYEILVRLKNEDKDGAKVALGRCEGSHGSLILLASNSNFGGGKEYLICSKIHDAEIVQDIGGVV